MCVCARALMYVCMCIYMYIHTHIHWYTYAYSCTEWNLITYTSYKYLYHFLRPSFFRLSLFYSYKDTLALQAMLFKTIAKKVLHIFRFRCTVVGTFIAYISFVLQIFHEQKYCRKQNHGHTYDKRWINNHHYLKIGVN